MSEKILIVEDEAVLRETLDYHFTRQGYTVAVARDGRQALTLAREKRPDIILLDIMLPELDGLEVCRILRQEMNTPIIMLTARDDEIDKVVGLEVGADDYLTKPFSLRELGARVKAQLRRERLIREETALAPEPQGRQLQFGALRLELDRREVFLNETVLHLKPKEYELLLHLIENRGRVLSRDQLLADVWGWDFSGGSRTVDVHIHWLREKIETDPTHPTRIVTARGMGYIFEG